MQLEIKQLKQGEQIFVPQTIAEAVLIKDEEVTTLDKVLSKKQSLSVNGIEHVFNSSTIKDPISIYAPSDPGDPGQIIINDDSGTPTWINPNNINTGSANKVNNKLTVGVGLAFDGNNEYDGSSNNNINLTTASEQSLGGVKIGENIDINEGVISIKHDNIINALGYTPINTIVSNEQSGLAPQIQEDTSSANTESLVLSYQDNKLAWRQLPPNTFKNTEYSAGEGLALEDNEFKNTGVLSVTIGDTEGTIKVNNTSVPVYGLKSAAYTESSMYAQKEHNHSYIDTISMPGFGDITAENNKVTLPEYPTELPNPHSLFIGGIEYDGSEEINITAEGIGAVTTLGTLSFSEGQFNGGEFKPTTDTTIKIPKTTDHIVEGNKLYFTTDRVIETITGGISTIVTKNLTKDKVLISNNNGKVTTSDITKDELLQLEGVRDNIQQQLDEHTHKYAESETEGGSAISAQRLTTNKAGDTNSPVYFEEGIPKACDSTLDVSITGNANTVGGYKIEIVEGTAGSNSKTIYFVI